jgi:L-malate glycosyltransferase
MRILRLYPFLPPQPGGMEQHVARLSVAQRALGHDVTIGFCEGQSTADVDIRVLGGHSIRSWRPIFLRELLFYGAAAVALRRRRGSFDVMHVHGDWAAAACGRLLARALAIPVRVFSAHGYLRSSPIWQRLLRFVLRGFVAGYATGANEAALLAHCMPDSVVFWQSSGIEELQQMNNRPCSPDVDVICVGNLYPKKNFSLVLDIAALLPHRRFRIVGDGPERAMLESKMRTRGLVNVDFAGSVPASAVKNYLEDARLFILTSFSEGTPTSMIEAMAAGRPVISSPSNNYDALISPGVNGYVLPGWNAGDYAERIESILNDPALEAAMGRKNAERAREFTWPRIASRVSSVMETCLRRVRGPSL